MCVHYTTGADRRRQRVTVKTTRLAENALLGLGSFLLAHAFRLGVIDAPQGIAGLLTRERRRSPSVHGWAIRRFQVVGAGREGSVWGPATLRSAQQTPEPHRFRDGRQA